MAKRKAKARATRQPKRVVDHEQIASLLEQSRGKHEAAKMARYQKQPDAKAILTEARDLRLQAHAADPEHTAPAWSEPANYDHGRLMAFYTQQLGEPA